MIMQIAVNYMYVAVPANRPLMVQLRVWIGRFAHSRDLEKAACCKHVCYDPTYIVSLVSRVGI